MDPENIKLPFVPDNEEGTGYIFVGPRQCGNYPACENLVIALIDPKIVLVEGTDKLACKLKLPKKSVPGMIALLESLR